MVQKEAYEGFINKVYEQGKTILIQSQELQLLDKKKKKANIKSTRYQNTLLVQSQLLTPDIYRKCLSTINSIFCQFDKFQSQYLQKYKTKTINLPEKDQVDAVQNNQ